MFFNSLTYILFLIIAVVGYYSLPLRFGRWWILLGSIVFYGFWKVEFLCLIVFSAFVDYYVSLRIHDSKKPVWRRFWLCVSLVINLGLLIYFKYTYFIIDNVTMLGNAVGADWHFDVGRIILPLGISFYTFVSLSYTIDIYRRLIDPVREFSLYLAYVMFWPHMIAGPILRGHELITQLRRGHRFHAENVLVGIKTIIAGLFLKVALADQLGPLVDNAFTTKASTLSGLDVFTIAFGFGFQIYFDFAGYSMIAIGSARILGIHFPENFNWPYLAVSPRDFWKRGHITLSSWVRDYLYLPLSGARYRDSSEGGIDVQEAGHRVTGVHLAIALFLSWFIMGLWHGARWNFVLWGLWHATFIYLYRLFKQFLPDLKGPWTVILGWCITIPVVMLGWIPFRAATLTQTFELYGRLFNPHGYLNRAFRENFYLFVFLVTVGMLCCAFLTHSGNRILQNKPVRYAAEVVVLAVMIFMVFIFLKPVSQFIYFQF